MYCTIYFIHAKFLNKKLESFGTSAVLMGLLLTVLPVMSRRGESTRGVGTALWLVGDSPGGRHTRQSSQGSVGSTRTRRVC